MTGTWHLGDSSGRAALVKPGTEVASHHDLDGLEVYGLAEYDFGKFKAISSRVTLALVA